MVSPDELSMSYGFLRSISWTIANGGLLGCLLLAVFYEGAIDPRLVLRRTAVYSFLIGGAVFLFAFFENYAAEVIASSLGMSEGLLEAGVGGAVLALALKPLHGFFTKVGESVLPRISPARPDEYPIPRDD